MEIRLREYKTTDYPTIKFFVEEMQDYISSIDNDKRIIRHPKFGTVYTNKMVKNVKNQEGKIYIAQLTNGIPIGFVAGFVLIQDNENKLSVIKTKTGYINKIYLQEEYRGNKFGTQMIARMEKYFKSIKCDGIWIEVDAFNNSALNHYKKIGFQEREIALLKKI
jgi:ribosomal protein S18 acetylase RimI-like enzyme